MNYLKCSNNFAADCKLDLCLKYYCRSVAIDNFPLLFFQRLSIQLRKLLRNTTKCVAWITLTVIALEISK